MLNIGVSGHKSLNNWYMVHSEDKGLTVHRGWSEKTDAGDVKEEENERFNGKVANTVIGPGAVVVHFIDTSVALAAVMNAKDLKRSTLIALRRIFSFLSLNFHLIFVMNWFQSLVFLTPIISVFLIFEPIFFAPEVIPFHIPRIIWWWCPIVWPISHCTKERRRHHTYQRWNTIERGVTFLYEISIVRGWVQHNH